MKERNESGEVSNLDGWGMDFSVDVELPTAFNAFGAALGECMPFKNNQVFFWTKPLSLAAVKHPVKTEGT